MLQVKTLLSQYNNLFKAPLSTSLMEGQEVNFPSRDYFVPPIRRNSLRFGINFYGGMALPIVGSISLIKYGLFGNYDGSIVNEAVKWGASSLASVVMLPLTIPVGLALSMASLLQLSDNDY